MTPTFNFFHYFLIIVIGQGVFLGSTLLLQKKGDPKANKLLGSLILLMTHFTLVFFLNDTGLRMKIGKLFLTGYSIVPLLPVIIFFYLKRLTNDEIANKKKYLHYIPFLIQFVYWLPNNTNGFIGLVDMSILDPFYSYTIVRVGSGVHIIIFIWYGYLCATNVDFQGIDIKKKSWIYVIRRLYWTMSIIFILGTLSLWFTDSQIARYIFFSFLSFFIYLIGYYGYTQSDILFDLVGKLKPRYTSSGLSREQSAIIYARLQEIMMTEKLFLNSGIRIAEAASKLGVSVHDLSRSVNENFGAPFQEFVNKYRVDTAKQILISEEIPPKMLAVALDSGFGNKVSFYKSFKKFTGGLPSEFVNR